MCFLNLFFPLSKKSWKTKPKNYFKYVNLPNSDILKRISTKQEKPPTFKVDIKSPLNQKLFSKSGTLVANCAVKPPAHQNGQRICFAILGTKCSPDRRGRDGIWALTSWGFPNKEALGLPYDFHQGGAPRKYSLLEEIEMQVSSYN